MEKKLTHLKVYADFARERLEEDPDTNREWAEKNIKIYDFLSDCTMNDLFKLFDSGMFNWVVCGYCGKAMDALNIDNDTKRKILDEIKYQFDFMSAKEAEEYYKNN